MSCEGCAMWMGGCGFAYRLKDKKLTDKVDCPCSYCIVKVTCVDSCEKIIEFDRILDAIDESFGARESMIERYPKVHSEDIYEQYVNDFPRTMAKNSSNRFL